MTEEMSPDALHGTFHFKKLADVTLDKTKVVLYVHTAMSFHRSTTRLKNHLQAKHFSN